MPTTTLQRLARRNLSRLNDMVTAASICRVAIDRAWTDATPVARCAEADASFAEEVQSVAQQRGWALLEAESYAWQKVQIRGNDKDALPRVVRVLKRDIFELDEMARRTDDEDVASLATSLREERRGTLVTLLAERPELGLPGAK